jgi:hypothetical protein
VKAVRSSVFDGCSFARIEALDGNDRTNVRKCYAHGVNIAIRIGGRWGALAGQREGGEQDREGLHGFFSFSLS